MSSVVQYFPRDERGKEILNEMEQRFEVGPYRTLKTGERFYWLAPGGNLDAALDETDSAWREHVARQTPDD